MKVWIPACLLVLLFACNDKPKNASPDSLPRDEMPAPVQNLFSQAEKFPDSTGLRWKLVNALDSLGAYGQAMSQMDSLIRRDSLSYGLWYRKAMLQENLHDTTGALRSYRYAIRIYPSPDAMLAAANLLAEKKDTVALALCKKVDALRLGREYTAHTSFITGVYYARSGDAKTAMDAFNRCIANDLNYNVAYMEKGFLFYQAKQYPEALQTFQTLATVQNTYPDAYYWMAKTYEAIHNTPEALNNYQRALALDPKLKEAEAGIARLKR